MDLKEALATEEVIYAGLDADKEAARNADRPIDDFDQTGGIESPTLDEYISRGQLAASAIDQGRWIIGDDACEIKTRYGKKTLELYAKSINVAKDRVEDYRGVCKFYSEYSVRTEFREANPMISFSHMRAAKRLKDVQKSYAFLEECSANGYTVELARIKLLEMLGKPTPPIRETFEAIIDAMRELDFKYGSDADYVRCLMLDHPDATIKVVIEYEAPTPPSS